MEKNSRVLFIGIDGTGIALGSEYTPNINKIMEKGSISKKVLSGNPTMSAECWGTMLTGTIPSLLGFNNDYIAVNKNSVSNKYPTIFKKLREKYKESNIVSICSWAPINFGIIEDDINVIKESESIPDDFKVKEKAVSYINQNDFKMMFIHFDTVDEEGHANGYNKEGYYKLLSVVDTYVLEIYNALLNRKMLDDTLIIITADHGGIKDNHGAYSELERFVYLGIRGPGIKENNKLDDNIYIRDIPAIIAKYLDIELGESFDSFIPNNLFIKELKQISRNEIFKKIPKDKNNINNINNLLSDNNLKVYINFDKNINNLIKDNSLINGNVKYIKGFFDNAANLRRDSYLAIKYGDLLTDDFSISFFIKINCIDKDTTVLFNTAIQVIFQHDNILIKLNDKSNNHYDVRIHYPNIKDEFFNLILAYDSTLKLFNVYVNHSLELSRKLNDDFMFMKDEEKQIKLGYDLNNDNDNNNNNNYDFIMNEFMIYNKALNNKDVKNLKEKYY